MAVIHDDGVLDNRGCGYFIFCVCMECLIFLYIAVYSFSSFFRVKSEACDTGPLNYPMPRIMFIQGISSTIGLVVFGPYSSEIVSADHSYFAGLRTLAKNRIYRFIMFHGVFECLWWSAALTALITVKSGSCDRSIMKALTKMIIIQAPVIFIRGFLHLFLPFYRYRLNRAYEKEIEKQAENASSDLPEVPLTKEQILIRDEKLNRARIRANLDVNFHEYENSYVEGRRLQELIDVKQTHGDARKIFEKVESDLMSSNKKKLAPLKKNKSKTKNKKLNQIHPQIESNEDQNEDQMIIKKKKKNKKLKLLNNGENNNLDKNNNTSQALLANQSKSHLSGVAVRTSDLPPIQLNVASQSTLAKIKARAQHH